MRVAVVDWEIGDVEGWEEEGEGLDVRRWGCERGGEEDGDLRRGSGVNEERDRREVGEGSLEGQLERGRECDGSGVGSLQQREWVHEEPESAGELTSMPKCTLSRPSAAALTSTSSPATKPFVSPPTPSHHLPSPNTPFLLELSTSLTHPSFLHLSTSFPNAPSPSLPLGLSNTRAPVSRTTPESYVRDVSLPPGCAALSMRVSWIARGGVALRRREAIVRAVIPVPTMTRCGGEELLSEDG